MANVFSGSGAGLSSIPNSATTATDVNTPNAIVARGAGGGFTAGSISAADVRAAGLLTNTGVTDFSGGQATLPVKAVLSANTPTNCQASRELLIKTDAPAGQQLFICNATGDGYALVGDGKAAGVTGVMAGDGSVAIGGTASQPTIAVASGGITSDKLAPGAVAGSIPDGSLTPAKITGTAATLGANIFSGNQIVQGSLASASLGTGPVSATSATISGSPSSNLVSITQSGSGSALSVTANGLSAVPAFNVSSIEGDAIHAQATFGAAFTGSSSNGTGIEGTGNNVGIQGNGATALSGNGTNIGVSANASANAGVAVTMTTGSAGKFLSGSSSAGQPFFTETFNVDNVGNIFSAGALSARLPNNAVGTGGNLLARLDGTGGVQHTSITDTSGIIGVVIGGSGTTGNAQIAYSGVVSCSFDTAAVAGDYVVNSSRSAGFCSDGGSAYPASGQVVGRILRSSGTPATIPILLFGSEIRGPAGTISFSQVTGTATAAQLPAAVVYNNQANTLTGDQTVNGSLTVSGQTVVLGTVAAQGFSGDGTSVFNVNAAKLQGFTPGDLASSSALNFETTNRQAADATLQNNINGLADGINNVSAADAKLAASNSFTAGTQDFSTAAATLPVRSVLSANTPASCVASKELLIKTDAPAGQQLFICDANGTTWNLVGDGASGAVSSFNGRSGSVSPAANDYSFAQLSGSASAAQLPTSVVYSNQANIFTANQTVNATMTANLFSGNGSGLSNVNAATLNGVPSSGFAQLGTANTFTARQTLAASSSASASLNIPSGSLPNSPIAGDIWNTGGVLQYRDNLSTNRALVSTTQSGGMQLLKLSGVITPASVASQSCGEQSFNVPGISTGDVLLAVAQPSTNSPGTNIAIGGSRVSAANTVAIQFCNVSRNNSTPVSGTYAFAVMR
ncbi:MAG TPA: hypothetical protein VLN58_16410 [Verrucomicrobiae bacterium]|nr:hypothetical protein [Verrucomicrobiae bacterium]